MQPTGGHACGQDASGSQSSPFSTTPFPHDGAQSLSLVALQLAGQHPSPLMHAVCMLVFVHRAAQVPGAVRTRS
jgi:hypothetical protein